jgi:hypothetical protein
MASAAHPLLWLQLPLRICQEMIMIECGSVELTICRESNALLEFLDGKVPCCRRIRNYIQSLFLHDGDLEGIRYCPGQKSAMTQL